MSSAEQDSSNDTAHAGPSSSLSPPPLAAAALPPASPTLMQATLRNTPTLRNRRSIIDTSSIYSEADRRSTLSPSGTTIDLYPEYEHEREDGDVSADLDELEDSMRQSQSIDDFTRIITEYRHERKRRSYHGLRGGAGAGHGRGHSNSSNLISPEAAGPSSIGLHYSHAHAERSGPSTPTGSGFLSLAPRRKRASSHAGSDDGSGAHRRSIDADAESITSRAGRGGSSSRRESWRPAQRCTCCCGLDSCERARIATIEWAEMEQDLRLAAEIGQALLRRNDALTASATSTESRHATQRDSLMKRLSRSIKESGQLEKQVEQLSLNLEAAESSNRALLAELEDTRSQLAKVKAEKAKLSAMEERSLRLARELDDAKQELHAERKRMTTVEARGKRAAERASKLAESLKRTSEETRVSRGEDRSHFTAQAIEKAKARLRESLKESDSAKPPSGTANDETLQALESLAVENESLYRQVDQTSALLNAANEELAGLREQEQFFYTGVAPSASRPGIHSRKTSSGFNDAYRVPSNINTPRRGSDARADMARDGGEEEGEGDGADEDFASQPATPALADELVAETDPFLLRARAASRSSLSSRGGDSPRLGVEPRLAGRSPSLTPQGSSLDTRDGTSLLSQPTTPASEAQKIRAAYSSIAPPASEAGSSSLDVPVVHAYPQRSPQPQEQARQRESRTALLMSLLDFVQRLFVRLSSADVDTLAKRLQRQHLAGDVGHLARVTINGITRDAEGLREHFRRLIEAEARGNLNVNANASCRDDTSSTNSGNSRGDRDKDNTRESESLVARKEFFALVKLMRDLLFEMAKLRNAINEVQLAPSNAGRILQEQLGAAAQEDKGMGAWLGKLLGGGGGAATGAVSGGGGGATQATQALSAAGPSQHASSAVTGSRYLGLGRPSGSHHPAPPRPASRASAAVLSSAVAVEVKGGARASSSTVVLPASRDVESADDAYLSSVDSSAPRGRQSLLPDMQRPQLRAVPGRSGGRGSLTRVQSRNLSGLFAGAPADGWGGGSSGGGWTTIHPKMAGGAGGGSGRDRPLSRIVDDDEVSIHHGKPGWGSDAEDDDDDKAGGRNEGDAADKTRPKMHRRGLSDSSIRSTFLEHEDHATGRGGAPGSRMGAGGMGARPSPAARIINRSTLALQPQPATLVAPSSQRSGGGGGSASGAGAGAGGGGLLSGLGKNLSNFGFPSLRTQTSAAALSLAAAASAGTSPSAGASAGTSTSTSTSNAKEKLSVPGSTSPAAAAAVSIGGRVPRRSSGVATPTLAASYTTSSPLSSPSPASASLTRTTSQARRRGTADAKMQSGSRSGAVNSFESEFERGVRLEEGGDAMDGVM